MKVGSLILLMFFSLSNNALFDDKTIEPFLGPYTVSHNNSQNCPTRLSLIAMCTLGQLNLKHTKEPDFDFLKFKRINEGEAITRVSGRELERTVTKFENLKLTSMKKSYIKRFDKWEEINTRLSLEPKRFTLTRTQHFSGKETVQLDCEYVFDEVENKRILESIK